MDMAKPAFVGGGSLVGGGNDPTPFARPGSFASVQSAGGINNQVSWGSNGALLGQQSVGGVPLDGPWSSGWPSSGPATLPRLGTPDNGQQLGRAVTGPPSQDGGYGPLIGRGDMHRAGSGFSDSLRPSVPQRGAMPQPMLGSVDMGKFGAPSQQVGPAQPWMNAATTGQVQFGGQRPPSSSLGHVSQAGRLFSDTSGMQMGLNQALGRQQQVSGPFPSTMSTGAYGNAGRPGSAGSVHSNSSYSRGVNNGLPGINNALPGRPSGNGDLEQQVLQQLHSLTMNGGGPLIGGGQRAAPVPPPYQQQASKPQDALAALLAQGRAQSPAGYGMQGLNGLAAQQGQQAQLLAARQQAARNEMIARGLNGNMANINMLQIAAAQQAAAVRAANAQRQQQVAFGTGLNGAYPGVQGANDLNKFANHAALIAEASRVAAARQQQQQQQQQQAAALNGLAAGLNNPYQTGLLNKPKAPPAPIRAAMPPRPVGLPSMRPAVPSVESLSLAHDQTARGVLMELGQTLAQLGITVEGAVNAGLLGGLSAADVKVLSDAHAHESRRLAINAHVDRMQQQVQPPASNGFAGVIGQQQQPVPPPQQIQQQQQQEMAPTQQVQQVQAPQRPPPPAVPPTQALFPHTFQLGSSLTDTPRNAADANNNNNNGASADGSAGMGAFSLGSGSSATSPFSFFGGLVPSDGAGVAADNDEHGAVLGSGNGNVAIGDGPGRLLAPNVIDNIAELVGDGSSFAQQQQAGKEDGMPGAFPHSLGTNSAGADGEHFDASAYAFFGSVEASDDDALPLDDKDDVEDVSAERQLSAGLQAAAAVDGEEGCPPTHPSARLGDNARLLASA